MPSEKYVSLLIVDDSQIARILLKKHIEVTCPDWDLREAAHGPEALEMLSGKSADIVCVDFNMPEMDGLELCREIRNKYPTTVLAILTANVQESFRQRVENEGIKFLAKPIGAKTAQDLKSIYDTTHGTPA